MGKYVSNNLRILSQNWAFQVKKNVACTPYLVTYLRRIEQYLEEKVF